MLKYRPADVRRKDFPWQNISCN